MTWFFPFVSGGVLLVVGAEMLVRGASRLAVAAGVTPLVVGLTVVALGTSAPELAVTAVASITGETDVALGNVVGSNIFNILVILGLSALIAPLVVDRRLVRFDLPVVIGASILTMVLGRDGLIGRWNGLLLFSGIVLYTALLIFRSRGANVVLDPTFEDGTDEGDAAPPVAASGGSVGWGPNGALVLAGLVFLVLGSRWLVGASVALAESLGISDLVIGLTIVAIGTSLPEVATSVLATLRGHREIAIGNAIGSNLFNLLAVLGLGGLLAPGGIPVPPGALTFDLPIMTAVALAALPLLFTGYAITRAEGAALLAYYVAYTVYLVLDATDHAALPNLDVALRWLVLPFTAVTLILLAVRAFREAPGTVSGEPS